MFKKIDVETTNNLLLDYFFFKVPKFVLNIKNW
jgi:hypothetical protein